MCRGRSPSWKRTAWLPLSCRAYGVDPGLKGGIGALNGGVWSCYRMPPYHELRPFWERLPKAELGVFLEQPLVLRLSGKKSLLTTGYGWGRLEEAIESAGHRLTRVSVREWQEHHLVWGTGLRGPAKKAAHVALANSKYGLDLKPSQDGMADGVLIGAYGDER